jgi:hypothetical protein
MKLWKSGVGGRKIHCSCWAKDREGRKQKQNQNPTQSHEAIKSKYLTGDEIIFSWSLCAFVLDFGVRP